VNENPLGKVRRYPQHYSPETLFTIPRSDSRKSLTGTGSLPFHGEDIWNAWELCWLDSCCKPVIAQAVLRFPADSPNLIESKSLKLYLYSHANCQYENSTGIRDVIAADLSAATGADVAVAVELAPGGASAIISQLPGTCIDASQINPANANTDASVLRTEAGKVVDETLHSHLLRSNCPITGQPDTGSILVRYAGDRIIPEGLLEYLVAYRYREAYHEDCVERIFVDLKTRCAPLKLTVYARYARRGGLDINPFRSDFERAAENLRLWRQ
jgi:7-cyano-7-deazaguanine reductase